MGSREAARKPIQRHGLKSTETDCQKTGRSGTEFLNSVDLGKGWAPLIESAFKMLDMTLIRI